MLRRPSSRERFTHEKVVFNENGTMTSVPTHPLVWVPEMSEGRSENDTLILPNIALLVSTDCYAFPGSGNARKTGWRAPPPPGRQ